MDVCFPIFVAICIEWDYTYRAHGHTRSALHIHGSHATHNVLSVHALPELFGFNEINYILPAFSRPKTFMPTLPAQENYGHPNSAIIIYITLPFFGNTWRLRVKYVFLLVNSNNSRTHSSTAVAMVTAIAALSWKKLLQLKYLENVKMA